jgi:hypothetical protein
MKIIEVLTIATLFLVPGAIAPVYAQGQREQEKQQQARPAQPQQRAQQQARPAQQQQRAQQQAKPAQQPQRAQQQARPAQQPQRAQQQARPAQQPQRAQQATPAQQPQRAQQQARPAQPQQRAQQQAQQQARSRPAQGSADRVQTAAGHGRIPDERFRASFGRGHTFHVSRTDFEGRSRRFQYGGFWFAMVNPWPAEWLYTDSVYVDYMNGEYFLCDPIHPGVYLSITVG